MPRRYHSYPDEWQVLNVLSTAGASILGMGYLLTFCYLTWSLFKGERASDNPWGVTGLEWQTTSPPPTFNFHTDPIVTEPPYHYKQVPGREATTIG
jgi:cytochrome c oxidase subunit 1